MKQISLICFRVYLEVYIVKNPTCFSRWSVSVNGICHSGRQWSEILGHGPNYVNTYIRNNGMNETLEMLKRYLKKVS